MLSGPWGAWVTPVVEWTPLVPTSHHVALRGQPIEAASSRQPHWVPLPQPSFGHARHLVAALWTETSFDEDPVDCSRAGLSSKVQPARGDEQQRHPDAGNQFGPSRQGDARSQMLAALVGDERGVNDGLCMKEGVQYGGTCVHAVGGLAEHPRTRYG